ncbi:hypothetical protein TCON_2198 [Astathelohania contejeani]|uniref:Uncharacterized protein n=1 Tax=Astathelohania contejeani TaxID=164912 RepID=A0ABQ7HWT5_9MICR|nr:hypothetical protein TCON_2198 [Thelohania contejeani]
MIIKLTLVLLIGCTELDAYNGRKLNILFSKFNHYKLGIRYGYNSDQIIAISKYLDPALYNFNDASYIFRWEGKYRIKLGDYYLCNENSILIVCTDEISLWEIIPQKFGYNIMKDNKCLTKTSGIKVLLEDCHSKNDSQILIFQIVPEIMECLNISGSAIPLPLVDDSKKKYIENEIEKLPEPIREDILPLVAEVNDSNFEKMINKKFPKIKNKTKSKKRLKAMWNFHIKKKHLGVFNSQNWMDLFCN